MQKTTSSDIKTLVIIYS